MTDDWQRNEITIRAEGIDWHGVTPQEFLERMADRMLNPWKYPDRPRLPVFEPFPRIARLETRWSKARKQTKTIWWNLRHLTEERPYDY